MLSTFAVRFTGSLRDFLGDSIDGFLAHGQRSKPNVKIDINPSELRFLQEQYASLSHRELEFWMREYQPAKARVDSSRAKSRLGLSQEEIDLAQKATIAHMFRLERGKVLARLRRYHS